MEWLEQQTARSEPAVAGMEVVFGAQQEEVDSSSRVIGMPGDVVAVLNAEHGGGTLERKSADRRICTDGRRREGDFQDNCQSRGEHSRVPGQLANTDAEHNCADAGTEVSTPPLSSRLLERW